MFVVLRIWFALGHTIHIFFFSTALFPLLLASFHTYLSTVAAPAGHESVVLRDAPYMPCSAMSACGRMYFWIASAAQRRIHSLGSLRPAWRTSSTRRHYALAGQTLWATPNISQIPRDDTILCCDAQYQSNP